MGSRNFRRIVKRLNRYIFSYGSRKFSANSQNPYDPKSSDDRRQFIRYCHEGYKKAHALILESTLKLEDEEKRFKSGKALAPTLHKNLHQRQVLKDFANSLAWIIAHNDESLARSWASGAAVDGYLIDKNLKSELKVVEYANSNPDGFAMLTDLTSCVQIGDVLVTTDGKPPLLLEIKEGDLNKEIVDLLEAPDPTGAEAEFRDKYKEELKALQQFERVKRQHDRMKLSETYARRKDRRFDLALDAEVAIQDDKEPGEHYLESIGNLCEQAREKGYAAITIDDCLGVVAIRRPISSARIWDASHALYHLEDHEQEKCNPRGDGFSIDEFKIYNTFEYEFINQHFGIIGYLPTTSSLIYLGEQIAKEIITGEIAVGIRLDVNKFMKMAKSGGVELKKVRASGSDKVSNARFKHDNKVLQTPTGAILGRGIFDKIIYEFETPKYALYKIGRLDKTAIELITQHQANPA